MNLRNVLRAYSLLRQLSDDESALLETLRQTNETERALLVETLSDKPSQKKSSKKDGEKRNIQKCDIDGCGLTKRAAIHKDAMLRGFHAFLAPVEKSAGGGGGRSLKSRSASLRQQMSSALKPLTDIISNGSADLCVECGKVPDDNVHHIKTFLDYHPFVSTAPPAEPSSNQATSGTGKGGAGDAHHAATGG